MKPNKRIIAIIMALMVFSLITGEVAAYDGADDSLMVSIESAGYLDLDGDQVEDDILTEFVIEVPNGDWTFRFTFIFCELELPSGLTFNCAILVIGTYNSLRLTMGWYNTAIESGWYTFSVYASAHGSDAPEPGEDSLVFDPPTEGLPGLPEIHIIEVIVT